MAYIDELRQRIEAAPRPSTCVICGRDLSDVKSVEGGVGPICRKKSIRVTPDAEATQETAEAVSA